jgi:hypothetical protein
MPQPEDTERNVHLWTEDGLKKPLEIVHLNTNATGLELDQWEITIVMTI